MSGGFYDGGQRPIADHDPTQQIQWEIQRLARSVGADIAAAIAQVVDAAVEALQEQIKEIVDTIVGYVTDPSSFITDLAVWAISVPHLVQGLLTIDIIPGLDASKIISGILSINLIPGLDVSKIISGVFGSGFIPGLDTSKIISGTFPQSMLNITNIPATIISGILDAARIPGLAASKITSGLFNVARIPGLDVSKIVSGVFGTGFIPGLDASKITSGTFAQSLIDGLPSSLAALLPISWFNIGQRAGANMVLDPTFADAGLWAAQNNNGAPSTEQTHNGNSTWKISSPPSPSTASLFFNSRASTAHASGINEMWRCRPGDRYYVECWYYAPASNVNTGGSNSDVRITVYIRDTNGVKPDTWPILGDNQLLPVVEGSWQKISGYFTIPAGYDRFAPYFRIGAAVPEGDVFYIGSPVVREVTESQNIVAALFGSVGASLTTLLDTIIPGLDASKITSGAFPTSMITGLLDGGGKIVESLLDVPLNVIDGLLDTGGAIFGSLIPGLDTSKITSGTFPQAMLDITSIPANIVSGVLATLNIPNLAASKITSGSFNVARIPGLDVSKIISGVFGVGFIPGLDTSKIVSGILNPVLLPDITAGMSTDLQGAIDAGVNALRNTPGIIGQAFSDFEEALSLIPTQIFNQFGGNSVPRASQAEANQAMQTLQSTINSHTGAINALQSIVDGSNGFREVITFKQAETTTFTGPGSFNYTIPEWAQFVDGIYLGAGGGGMGGNNIVPVHGEGGDAGQWATETLVRGVDFPSGGAVLSGTVGAGGNGGNVNTAGGAGASVTRNAISGGKAAIIATGGAGGNIQDTAQSVGDGPGDVVVQGRTYFGGLGGSSHAGQHGGPGGIGAGGGGGAGATWLIAWTGGDGGPGRAAFCARAAMPAAFTSMGTKILPAYRLNTGVCSTDAQTVAAAWGTVPQNASGYILYQRADTTFSNYVYLRVRLVAGETQYTVGRVSAGSDTPWKSGIITEAIPFNAFSLTSDDDYTFTVSINGSPIDSYVDAAHSSSKGASYRSGGWGSSSDGLPGSLMQFAFFDSGTPSRITSDTVAIEQTVTSTSYVDLATTGPSVTINVPPSGEIVVDISTWAWVKNNGQIGYMSFTLSGANTLAANDNNGAIFGSSYQVVGTQTRRVHLTGLNPGTTTVKCQYRTSGGTTSFSNRNIIVEPKP